MKKILKKAGIIGLTSILFISGCSPEATDNEPPKASAESPSTATGEGSPNEVPWVVTRNTVRINTNDPFQAAVSVSKTLWASITDQNRPGGIVLLSPEDWQTAAVSTNLVHFPNNGPVLFTNKDKIPEVTINEIKRLNPIGTKENQGIQVIIVGDLEQKVEEQIQSLGFKTDRIRANNPADYAKAIDAYYARAAGSPPQSVVVGSMESPEFTLPAVNWISHMPEPLLYVTKDEIPQETVDALKTRNGKANIYLIGPQSAVSSGVAQQLSQYGKVTRISGENPYENAIAFAKYKDNTTQFGWGITTPGHNVSFIPNGSTMLAIAAAPFSHLGKHAPLLWTDQNKMPEAVMTYLMSIQPKYQTSPAEGPYNHAWLTGTEEEISKAAQAEIDDMLEIISATGQGHGGMDMGEADKDENNNEQGNMPGMKH